MTPRPTTCIAKALPHESTPTIQPNIKIIISLRNPIDRAFSHWNMFRLLGLESLPFGEAIRREEERVRAVPNEEQWRLGSYVDRGYYVEQIRRLRRYFSPYQILVLKQEDLRDKPKITLNSIWDFLEVDRQQAVGSIEKMVGHYSGSVSEADRQYLRGLFEFEIKSLEQMLDWDSSDWLAP